MLFLLQVRPLVFSAKMGQGARQIDLSPVIVLQDFWEMDAVSMQATENLVTVVIRPLLLIKFSHSPCEGNLNG